MAEMTAFILAGGASSRFGTNKALALWNGKPLLAHMAALLMPIFPERFVLAKSPGEYAVLNLDVPVLPDSVEKRHPMAGVLSALKASRTEWSFVCACDMPLLRTELVAEMAKAAPGHDVVVPVWREKVQPLCGLYGKRCTGFIDELLREDHAHCIDLYGRVKTRFFLEHEVARTDPEGLTFMDVDTPQDLKAVRARSL